jgi:hypothetical protein
MARFIVRYRGKGAKPEDAARRLKRVKDARVLDETRKMLLVEGPEEAIRSAFGDDDWVIEPEQIYQVPEPRPRIRRRPE